MMTTPAPARKVLELKVVCANTTKDHPCPLGGIPFTATGPSRKGVLKRGRGYCSRACSDVGRRRNVSAAMRTMWANTAARARMMSARRRALQGEATC
jgi:hypothetical protein